MAAHSTEGQMDFTFDNQTGPTDQNSPWLRFPSSASSQQRDGIPKKRKTRARAHSSPSNNKSSGTHSVFDSPAKMQSFASLRPPGAGQTHLFSSPQTNQWSFSGNDPAFTTPRQQEPEYPSSGPDSTPENNEADSEATPDTGANSSFYNNGRSLRSSLGRSGLSNPLASRGRGSPGKGEIPRVQYSDKIRRRVLHRRQNESDRRLVRHRGSVDLDDSDMEKSPGKALKERPRERSRQDVSTSSSDEKGSRPSLVATLFSFIDTHPDLPHILSFYAQLLLNVFLVIFFIYIIYSFWATIRADVDKKSEEAILDIMAEMKACARDFQENRCDQERRAPALDSVCDNWKRCMERDPTKVGRAKVSAHTFAEIFNSFIEPISIKAMVFSVTLALGCFAISNIAFGLFRSRAIQRSAPPAPGPPPYGLPATPQHWHSPQNPPDWSYWSHPQHSPMTSPHHQAYGPHGAANDPGMNAWSSQTPTRKGLDYR